MSSAIRITAAVALAGSLALVSGMLGPTLGPGGALAAEAPSPSPSTDLARVEGVAEIIAVEDPGEWDRSGPWGVSGVWRYANETR